MRSSSQAALPLLGKAEGCAAQLPSSSGIQAGNPCMSTGQLNWISSAVQLPTCV